MIFYSILPNEVVFHDEEEQTKEQIVELNHVKMVVEPVSESECKIVQLISSNPQDYLDPRYQPGNTVSLTPDL